MWEYDTSVDSAARSGTWTPTDTSVDKPDISLEFYYSATFPDASSLSKGRKRESTSESVSDVWDNGT